MTLFCDASPSEGFPAIAQLPWSTDPARARFGAHEILMSETNLTSNLAAWLKGLDPPQVDFIIERSVERTSHYKWLLGGNRHSYLIWLHQYKPPPQFARADRFAASVHDHRLWFSSRVISGALHVTWYSAEIVGEAASLKVLKQLRLSAGMGAELEPHEIHKIDQVETRTATFVVQGPAERRFSTVFNLSDGSMRREYDLDALYPRLVDGLAQ
jgi:hypothetical protein